MTRIDEIQSANYPLVSKRVATQFLATSLLMLGFAFLSKGSFAQGLSSNLKDDAATSLEPVLHSMPAYDSDFGAYDQRQIETLEDMGRLSQSAGEHRQALALFKQALHVARINQGLYHVSQIPIVDDIISAEIALQNWEGVNDYYAYQEHLYKRLYGKDDPRLEVGLRKISAWHVTALNVNLDGKRIEHLRKANKLFKLRMQVAENTLSLDDPKFSMLARNIALFERELFLASDLNREMMVRQTRDPQPRRNSMRQEQSRLVVSSD